MRLTGWTLGTADAVRVLQAVLAFGLRKSPRGFEEDDQNAKYLQGTKKETIVIVCSVDCRSEAIQLMDEQSVSATTSQVEVFPKKKCHPNQLG